jgi:hypothetical protein
MHKRRLSHLLLTADTAQMSMNADAGIYDEP